MERNRFVYMRYNKVGRSTSAQEGNIMFPRKDDNAPRTIIYRIECPEQLQAFDTCMEENNGDLGKCGGPKNLLESCGNAAFKRINAQTVPYDYAKAAQK